MREAQVQKRYAAEMAKNGESAAKTRVRRWARSKARGSSIRMAKTQPDSLEAMARRNAMSVATYHFHDLERSHWSQQSHAAMPKRKTRRSAAAAGQMTAS